MRFEVYQYRLPMEGALDDLNAALASGRVVGVSHHVVSTREGGLLVFVVEKTGAVSPSPADRRIDYRERLSPDDFTLYSRLRDLRKQFAERDGLPVFAVFSNSQLAEMAERRVRDESELKRIAGVGAAKVEKYGHDFLAEIAISRAKTEGGER